MHSIRYVLLVAIALTAGAACAQSEHPGKPIRLVVGFPPGGISDVLGRAIAAKLSAAIGQQVVVDNRAGAGTTIASDIVAKSPADGRTLFMQDVTTHAINASLYKKLPYDSVKDFSPISLVATTPLMLVVHPSLPVRNVKDLIALAKAKPGEIAYGSSGNGTILHLTAEYFKTAAGVNLVHIPYKGSAPAVQALLGGEVAVVFSSMPPAITNVQAGRLRALGVTTPRRTPAAPEIPTIAEAGLRSFEIVLYSGILGPANLPAAVVSRLNAELVKLVNTADFKQVLVNVGAEPLTDTPEHFRAHLEADIVKLAKIVRASGAKVD